MFTIIREFKSLIPSEEQNSAHFDETNNIYRSLITLFKSFWISYEKELYLVGGVVRDLLLGRTPKDYDLTTNATPDEVKQICSSLGLKTFDSGIKHGTLTIIDDVYGQSYEITSYRVDGKYTDGRHPDEVVFTSSLEEDLKRRDFTINSFTYNLLTKELVMLDESYLNDLEFGVIRTVGKAQDRFKEDALRMLRALRFAAQLNFIIHEETYHAIEACASLLKNISKERIRDELTKILLSDNPDIFIYFIISGLEKYAFDGEEPFKQCLLCNHQNKWHYTDVFHHTMDVVRNTPKKLEVRWAALLHDVGKPDVKALKEGSETEYTYYSHPKVSAEKTLNLLKLLKFSNTQIDLIYKYVLNHDVNLATCKNATFKRLLVEIGKENFSDFLKLKRADSFAHNLSNSVRIAVDDQSKTYERFTQIVNQEQPLSLKDLSVNGYDLMSLGLQGAEIGKALQFLLQRVLEQPELNTKEKLLSLLNEIK